MPSLPPKELDDAEKSRPLPVPVASGARTEKEVWSSLYRKHQYLSHSCSANTACKTRLDRTRVRRIKKSQSWLTCSSIQLWGGGEHHTGKASGSSLHLNSLTLGPAERGVPKASSSSWRGRVRTTHKSSQWHIHKVSLSKPPQTGLTRLGLGFILLCINISTEPRDLGQQLKKM